MSITPPQPGPMHLKDHLANCTEDLESTIRQAVAHPISSVRSIFCVCGPCKMTKIIEKDQSSRDPKRQKAASSRREKINRHLKKRISKGSTNRLQSASKSRANAGSSKACQIFAVEVNEEDGVVRAFCRRCKKMFLVFDRSLYWGLPRDHSSPPESWAYRCVCGGHSFEIGVGFEYSDPPLDENDIHNVTVAVRCCACDSISMVLDEEG